MVYSSCSSWPEGVQSVRRRLPQPGPELAEGDRLGEREVPQREAAPEPERWEWELAGPKSPVAGQGPWMERGASVVGWWERERLLESVVVVVERGGRLEAVERSWVVGREQDGVAVAAVPYSAGDCHRENPYARCDGPYRPGTGERCAFHWADGWSWSKRSPALGRPATAACWAM